MVKNRWKKIINVFITSRLGMIGTGIILFFIIIALFGPLIAPFDPHERVGQPFQHPSSQYLLGTNDIGQDIFSEIIYGTRISLVIGSIAAFLSTSIGSLIGILSGYIGGKLDSFLMRSVDLLLVIPFLPLMILLAAFVGPSFWNIIFVISFLSWASTARIIRSQILSLKTKGYIEAAKLIGTSTFKTLYLHLLPPVLPIVVSQFVLAASHSILIESSLSFLGLGDPLTKSWGTVLYYAQARSAFLTDSWLWWILPPGLLITTLVIGFAFVGFSLEEILNPRLRRTAK